jgi:predicted nucleotidyltransferase
MASESKKLIEATHFSPDTLEFIRVLQKHRVRYVVIGGEAVIFYGHARFTGDVDFFYSTDLENTECLFAALVEFWDGNVPGIRGPAELREPGYIVQFGRPPNRIDLLSSADGVTFEEVWQTRQIVDIEGPGKLQTAIIDIGKLIQNKRSAGRPKDLDDLKFLEQTKV